MPNEQLLPKRVVIQIPKLNTAAKSDFSHFFFNLKKNRKKKEKLLFSHVTVLLETIDKRT